MVTLSPAKVYPIIFAIATVRIKYTFSVISDFRQSSSTRCTFTTSASSKVETTLGAYYANKSWQICQSQKFDVANEFAICSLYKSFEYAPAYICFFLNEESQWIKNMMRKKKRLPLEFFFGYFLFHDILSLFNIWHSNDSSSFKHDEYERFWKIVNGMTRGSSVFIAQRRVIITLKASWVNINSVSFVSDHLPAK